MNGLCNHPLSPYSAENKEQCNNREDYPLKGLQLTLGQQVQGRDDPHFQTDFL